MSWCGGTNTGMDIAVGCADCVAERDHCHGTLIEHADGVVECTDDRCVMPYPVRHAMVVDCDAFAAGCGCDAHDRWNNMMLSDSAAS